MQMLFFLLILVVINAYWHHPQEDYIATTYRYIQPIFRILNDRDLKNFKRSYIPVDDPPMAREYKQGSCENGQFLDTCINATGYYCYPLPKLPELKNRKRLSMLTSPHKLSECLSAVDCPSEMTPSGCDKTYKYSEYRAYGGYGFCMKLEPFSYTLSEIYNSLPLGISTKEKNKYLPVSYDVNEKGVPRDCKMTRRNCGMEEFCDYVHRYPENLHTSYSRCYPVPEFPDSNQGKRLLPLTKDDEKVVLTCNKHEDCACSECQKGELIRCDIDTGLWFKNAITMATDIGICLKGNPISYVLSEIYINLPADVSYEERKKYFPVDFIKMSDLLKLTSTYLTNCAKHSDCAEGQFCDNSLDYVKKSWSHIGSYCFPIPSFGESIKFTLAPEEKGLMLCNGPSDCPWDLFCNLETGNKYAKWDEKINQRELFDGLCMRGPKCVDSELNETFKWEFGASPSRSQTSCNIDRDCTGKRETADLFLQSYCNLRNVIGDVNLCCHREIAPCKHGKIVGSTVQCQRNNASDLFEQGGFAECNEGLEKMRSQVEKSERWCDEGNYQCCQDETTYEQFCPDGQTPLFNEPKCQNYDESLSDSGECVGRAGSFCKNGHCCPGTILDFDGTLIRSKYSYHTNHPCQPGIRPPRFPAGFCDPESGMVVIWGDLSVLNETLTRSSDDDSKKCEKDSDCSSDNSTLCIYEENDSTAYCYYNPMREIPSIFRENFHLISIIIVVSIVIGVLLIIGVVVGVVVVLLKKKKMKMMLKVSKPKRGGVQSPQTPSKSAESKVSTESVTATNKPTVK